MQEVAGALRLDTELSADSAAYIEELYEQYLTSPTSVSEDWRAYFNKFPKGDQPHGTVREQFVLLGRNSNRGQAVATSAVSPAHEHRQIGILQLIAGYRNRGHQKARLDPLGIAPREDVPDLELSTHGLTKSDLDTVFNTGNLAIGQEKATLGEMIAAMEATYCQSIGAEYMHIVDTTEKRWIQQRLEGARGQYNLSNEQKKHLLERLTAAEGLEKYLGNKYVGAKRFGVEGAESFIPMVNELIQRAGAVGCKEVVIGMPHRGRLNLLVNIMGKNPADLFGEFEGKSSSKKGSGDVKYHQGFSSNVITPGGEVHLALAFNPSHLEIVGPVVEGSVRARQVRRKDIGGDDVLPIIVHGDAAFAGQGVNMETFQMSQTRGYTVGGTVHIVVNNQVGFTTSNPKDARSTEYCTDVAKMVQAPIFHVNGDDPEAVVFISQLAHDFRHTFRKDVVIDLFCYRRRGHNEADEPSATQPMMYKVISQKATTRTLYADTLVQQNILGRAEADRLIEEYREDLEAGKHVANALVLEPNNKMFVDWTPYLGHEYTDHWDTSFSLERLKELGRVMHTLPDGFQMQRQVSKVIDERFKMQTGEIPLNWGAAETLAYATILDDGFLVRISGEDVGRGTFSHRHAKLHNQVDGSEYLPLCHIRENQPRFALWDSLLSEEAVLAYEYGYATTQPHALVVWEAQFGDFVNCAQVVIDQFIASGETKWERVCGLTMLLPHGFEGQGPEHSSARLERFLQLCAEDNMQVITPTTPAQIFHALRRQVIRPLRKPLIVMSPKSLLRHKGAVSTLDELATGQFQTVIDEVDSLNKSDVKRVVLCGGKVYYDLLEKRRAEKLNVAIVRVEQLYPYPEKRLADVLATYPNLTHLVWCQEEPKNQGAWHFIAPQLVEGVMKSGRFIKLEFAGRAAAAAPACGSPYLHAKQQAQLVIDALAIEIE
ncbi:2-oxoglutarate dehydrogenase E1 component [Acinetobacter apis]|uniref:2-oxoglutarate dehydrogenase E1 component n=1 Tax=Acinetobacter apis TaxID=1229165 RepID=A0A217ECZ8_9GAMM|nr:2-oxoglutarate dehydrogenase E1 component [Acinetobacter apis]SNQ28284.1 2-oxoglutarate dehydrogenase E1 component [Acinetobacter apis]